MKSLVTYYSYSGHTENVINIFSDILKTNGEVTIQRLVPKEEIRSFLAQCRAARSYKRTDLKEGIKYDASPYDLILIASPVWAFAPVPAMNTYFDNLSGLNGKKVVVLLTSGSGLGVNNCFKNMRAVLHNKGAASISEINIPDRKQSDNHFIRTSLEKVL